MRIESWFERLIKFTKQMISLKKRCKKKEECHLFADQIKEAVDFRSDGLVVTEAVII